MSVRMSPTIYKRPLRTSDNIPDLILHPTPTNYTRLLPHYKARPVTRSNSCYPRCSWLVPAALLIPAYTRAGKWAFSAVYPTLHQCRTPKRSSRVSWLVAANNHGDDTMLCEGRGRSLSFLEPFSLSSFLPPFPRPQRSVTTYFPLTYPIHLSCTGQSTAFG